MSKLYRIANWSELYENNRTRDMKHMQWLPIPNRHDGDGYTTLVDRDNGAALFGAWVAILQVASRCETRGTLLRDGAGPHDEASLARMTRLPKKLIAEALKVCSEECKWLDISESHDPAEKRGQTAGIPHPTDEERKGTEEKGTEEKGTEGNGTAAATPADVVAAWNLTGLPKVATMTDSRKASLKARLSEPFFREKWRDAIGKVSTSDFCRGATPRGDWKATFDWFITPDAAVKIMEGKYDNGGKSKGVATVPLRLEDQPEIWDPMAPENGGGQ